MKVVTNILSIYHFTRCGIGIMQDIYFQKKYNKLQLDPIIALLESKFDYSFTSAQRKRIAKLYGLLIPVFIHKSFAILQNLPLSEGQKKRICYLSIISPILDDIIDENLIHHSTLSSLIENPIAPPGAHPFVQIFCYLQDELLKSDKNNKEYIQRCHIVLKYQIESMAQINSTLKYETIQDITYNKGGSSVLFWLGERIKSSKNNMEPLAFTVGALLQAGNDIFDIYKDTQEGIHSWANAAPSINELQIQYTKLINKQNQLISDCHATADAKIEFSYRINSIHARCLVALEILNKNFPAATDLSFKFWKNQKRSQVVIDMEKPLHILKWIINTWKISNLR